VESGYRTPLLDLFRRGEVTRDVRLLAAQGALAPRAHEQLGLLVQLVEDEDPEVARAAEQTLSIIPRDSLAAFLARSDIGADMRAFFSKRGIEPAAVAASDAEVPLLDTGPEEEQAAEEGDDEQRKESALKKIAGLTVAQRIALAMKGTREERAILIRDANKIVGVAVLSSPKITDQEIESIAKMPTISDELLRMIAHTRAWVKNYGVALGLVKNPKTPLAISMNLLQRLNERDMRLLSQDRNIPDTLRVTARKKVVVEK
jgi:hypothetical protein